MAEHVNKDNFKEEMVKDNVIKNYSREKSTDDLNKYIRGSIERNVGDLNGEIKYIC